jgi:hypothetical protein
MDQQSDDATTTTKPTTDSTDDDLVHDIMGQFDVDFDTLCVHVAERKQEELKAEGKHPHHRPTKRMVNPVVAPPGDVRRLLGDKVKTISGTPYVFLSTRLKWQIVSIVSPLTTIQRRPVLSLTKVLMGVLQGMTVKS